MTKSNDVPKMSNHQYANQLVECLMIWGLSIDDANQIVNLIRKDIAFRGATDQWKPKSKQTREQLEAVAKSVEQAVWGKRGDVTKGFE